MFRDKYEYDIELEDTIIGAVIIEQTAFARIKGLISKEMIYNDFNADVFEVCSELFDRSSPIDLAILVQECYKRKLADKYTDLAHRLSVKTNIVASSANIETHCLYLRELYCKRLLIEAKQQADTDYDVIKSMDELQEKLKKARELKATNDWQKFNDILLDIRMKISEKAEDGVKTGISELDAIRGGLKPTEVIVVGARPSVGKTAFAGQIALNMARNGHKVGIISLEMSNAQLGMRIFSIISGVEFWKLDRHMINSEAEMDVISDYMDKSLHLPIFMSEKTGVTISDIRAKAMKLIYKNSLDVLFIDYLGLIEPEQHKNRNREQEISAMSRGLKLLAMETNIPIVVLAQLNRSVETRGVGKKPMLSDLRDSGSIEQDADVVIFLHSDYKAGVLTNSTGGSTEYERDIVVAKYRNGETKDFKIGFEPKKMMFVDYVQEQEKMEYSEQPKAVNFF